MRLFIAINFSNETRSKLAFLRDELRAKAFHGYFSEAENLHLTLAFLGECDIKQLTAAKKALVSLTIQPMEICLDHIGRFRRDHGNIWWAGIKENDALFQLQRNVTQRLISAGFLLDRQIYSPHITLAREVMAEVQPWRIEPFGETVHSIELMKSERIQGKLTYTAIFRKGAANDATAD